MSHIHSEKGITPIDNPNTVLYVNTYERNRKIREHGQAATPRAQDPDGLERQEGSGHGKTKVRRGLNAPEDRRTLRPH